MSPVIIFLMMVMLCSCQHPHGGSKTYRAVEVRSTDEGQVLYRNGQPFEIRGAAGEQHLATLQAMGGNTIRIYDTLNLGVLLDSAHAHDLAVIVGLWMMGETEMDYTDSFKVARQYAVIKHTINRYKEHPALLMWCLGNEISYTVENSEYYNPKEVWLAFAGLVDMIHQEDPDHPVTTTITNFQKKRLLYFKMYVPQLDIIAINTFGRIKGLAAEAEKWGWFFNKPFFLAEWAIKGPWESDETIWYTPLEENSSEKARNYRRFYTEYVPHDNPRFLGSCVFYWGQKQEHTHTWFGLFSASGEESEMVETLRYTWTGKKAENLAPRVRSLRLDGRLQNDTLIFKPHQLLGARLNAIDPEGGPLSVEWELLPDQWHFEYRAINHRPKALDGLIQQKSLKSVKFKAPAEPGTYRLFATIHDASAKKFATANIPFLVE